MSHRCLDEELRSDVLETMTTRQAAQLVTEMTPDDRAEVLDELEEAQELGDNHHSDRELRTPVHP